MQKKTRSLLEELDSMCVAAPHVIETRASTAAEVQLYYKQVRR